MEEKMEEKMDNIDDLINDSELPWDIIGSYFRGQHLNQLIRHQLESYNTFISSEIAHGNVNPVVIASEQDYDKEKKFINYKFL